MSATERGSTGPPIGQGGSRRPSIKRLETWLWTGPIGHLAGGALDLGHALARYLVARALGRSIR